MEPGLPSGSGHGGWYDDALAGMMDPHDDAASVGGLASAAGGSGSGRVPALTPRPLPLDMAAWLVETPRSAGGGDRRVVDGLGGVKAEGGSQLALREPAERGRRSSRPSIWRCA